MKITTRLVLSFLLVSVLPLGLVGYLGLQAMRRVRTLAIEESTQALRQLGEASIYQKSLDVARQVALYLEAHPGLDAQSVESLATDLELAGIAVQAVGETGYTAVYDQDGIVYFHANPAMVGRDMHELAEALPAFWAIYEASLDGTLVASYYDWQDADGVVRAKYMSCVPVGATRFRVAATTYIDEFSRPLRDTEASIEAVFVDTRRDLVWVVAVLGGLATLLALWLAWGISRPIISVAEAAAEVESERFELASLSAVTGRRDEIGQLARLFRRMADQVYQRELHLKQRVHELRIEIDEVKKHHQVLEITETEYFQHLLDKVAELRARHAFKD